MSFNAYHENFWIYNTLANNEGPDEMLHNSVGKCFTLSDVQVFPIPWEMCFYVSRRYIPPRPRVYRFLGQIVLTYSKHSKILNLFPSSNKRFLGLELTKCLSE